MVAERVKQARRIAGPGCHGCWVLTDAGQGKESDPEALAEGMVDPLPGWRGRTLEPQSGKLTGGGAHLSPLSSFICTSSTAIHEAQFEHHP